MGGIFLSQYHQKGEAMNRADSAVFWMFTILTFSLIGYAGCIAWQQWQTP